MATLAQQLMSTAPGRELVAQIRAEAEAGVMAVIPRIRAEVRAEVAPVLVGAYLLAGLGVVLGWAAWRK